MGSEIDVIQCYGGPNIALWSGSDGGTISISALNEIWKIQKFVLT